MSKTERLFHPRTLVIHPDFKNLEEFIVSIPERFQRNEVLLFTKGAMNCGKWNTMAKNMLSNPFTAPTLSTGLYMAYFVHPRQNALTTMQKCC